MLKTFNVWEPGSEKPIEVGATRAYVTERGDLEFQVHKVHDGWLGETSTVAAWAAGAWNKFEEVGEES